MPGVNEGGHRPTRCDWGRDWEPGDDEDAAAAATGDVAPYVPPASARSQPGEGGALAAATASADGREGKMGAPPRGRRQRRRGGGSGIRRGSVPEAAANAVAMAGGRQGRRDGGWGERGGGRGKGGAKEGHRTGRGKSCRLPRLASYLDGEAVERSGDDEGEAPSPRHHARGGRAWRKSRGAGRRRGARRPSLPRHDSGGGSGGVEAERRVVGVGGKTAMMAKDDDLGDSSGGGGPGRDRT